jgi:hypothetical protein
VTRESDTDGRSESLLKVAVADRVLVNHWTRHSRGRLSNPNFSLSAAFVHTGIMAILQTDGYK